MESEHVCLICSRNAVFKVKGEGVFYCKEHAEEFFSVDCLIETRKIEVGARQAEVLNEFLKKISN